MEKLIGRLCIEMTSNAFIFAAQTEWNQYQEDIIYVKLHEIRKIANGRNLILQSICGGLVHSYNIGARKINSCHITKPMINDRA